MSNLRTAAQQALEALEYENSWHAHHKIKPYASTIDAIIALKAALEQPEQEPVAWLLTGGTDVYLASEFSPGSEHEHEWTPLYAHPPRREWRGLTDEQLLFVYNELPNWGMDMDSLSPKLKQFARAIEAALKERNA